MALVKALLLVVSACFSSPFVEKAATPARSSVRLRLVAKYFAPLRASISGALPPAGALLFIELDRLMSSITSNAGGQGAWRSEERRVGKEWRSRWSPYH